MKQTNVKLIELTTKDLIKSLKSYQMDLITDIVISYKNQNKQLTPTCVAKLMMAVSNGFRSNEFDDLLEKYPVPFVVANTHDELIKELYYNPSLFIDPSILDSDEPFLVKVDDTFLDQNRILNNI
jgi:hypothetical protein